MNVNIAMVLYVCVEASFKAEFRVDSLLGFRRVNDLDGIDDL